MVQPPSRRSFLFGRQATAQDDWSKFVVTLKHACHGAVKLVAENALHLQPATLDDVVQARKLCKEHGVVMALDGLALTPADQNRFVLWVEAGSAWGTLIPLGDTGLWRVDAGCPLAVMQAAGLLKDPLNTGVVNLAQWFALSFRQQRLSATDLASHLVSVDWLLPDGTIEVFGAFGARDSQPLGSLAAQKLVPKLFELSSRPEVREALRQGHWGSRFHLDALADIEQVNLAHFFIGHAGALGWLVAATFMKTEAPLQAPPQTPLHALLGTALDGSTDNGAATHLDLQTKQVVDPDRVFVSLAEQTG